MRGLPLVDRPGDDPIAHYRGREIPVAAFLGQVMELSARLPADRGYVVNLCTDRYAFSVGFAAAIAAGQTNLLPGNRLPATVAGLLQRYRDAYVLSDEDTEHDWPVRIDPRPVLLDFDRSAHAPEIDGSHIAAIAFTSGSTGRAKPIEKTWFTLYEGARVNAAEMGLDGTTARHMVATVPPQHMYGLETSVLLPWRAPVAVSHARPFTPVDIAEHLAALPPARVLVSTPVHLRAISEAQWGEAQRDLPALERVFSATAPLDAELSRAIEHQRGARVLEIYGCSETGSLARRYPALDDSWRLFDAFSLRIDGEQAHVSAPHLPGPVELQDRIETLGDNRLRLLGRTEDLVNIAGKRASLADLNQRLLRVAGVRDGIIFEPPASSGGAVRRLAALVVAPTLDAHDIRRALRETVDEAFLPRPIRRVDALPRSETGKLTRAAVIEAFEAAGQRQGHAPVALQDPVEPTSGEGR